MLCFEGQVYLLAGCYVSMKVNKHKNYIRFSHLRRTLSANIGT